MMNKKAQVISVDLIAALMMFLVILSLGIWLINYVGFVHSQLDLRTDLEQMLETSMLTLFTKSGQPINWHTLAVSDMNTSSILSIGTSIGDGVTLDWFKLNALDRNFHSTIYSDVLRRQLGILDARIDVVFYVYVFEQNSGEFSQLPLFVIGEPLQQEALIRIRQTRYHYITTGIEGVPLTINVPVKVVGEIYYAQ
ncbi:MAG: hypothetical protein ACMXYE_03110 [Candidatus Woesearchaeota archaeon]